LGLIVEIDGDIHAQRQEYDADRASILEGMGLRVVRFTNEQVLRETDAVFNRLDELTR
jgi:very-short-patch-repair endonuclease